MTSQENSFILAIDTVSEFPSASIFNENNNEFNSITLLKQSKTGLNTELKLGKTGLKLQRFDSATFSNIIFDLCDSVSCKAHQISKLIFCPGPGAFSPIRVSIIFARTLKLLNQNLEVYKFNLLTLIFWKLKKENLISKDINSICLKAGLIGYFKETYNIENLNPIEEAHLVNDCENSLLIEQNKTNFNLSEFMIYCLRDKNNKFIQLNTINEIQPLYLRQPSVTKKK